MAQPRTKWGMLDLRHAARAGPPEDDWNCHPESAHTPSGKAILTHRTVLGSVPAFDMKSLLSATAHSRLFRARLAPCGCDSRPRTLPASPRVRLAARAVLTDGAARNNGTHTMGTIVAASTEQHRGMARLAYGHICTPDRERKP